MVRWDARGRKHAWLLLLSQRSNRWTPIRQMGVKIIIFRQARTRAAPLHTYTVHVS